MIKGVIFDLDGTLLDTITDLNVSLNKMLRMLDYPTITEEEHMKRMGQGIKHLVFNMFSEDVDEEYKEDALKLFKTIYAQDSNKYTVAYHGINDLINVLEGMDIKLAVLTNKDHDLTPPLIESHFDNEWHSILGISEHLQRKPDPQGIYQIVESMGLEKDEVLMIGDTHNDILAARNAGVRSVAVTWGFRTRDELVGYNPDFMVDSPQEILEIVDSLNELI